MHVVAFIEYEEKYIHGCGLNDFCRHVDLRYLILVELYMNRIGGVYGRFCRIVEERHN